MDRQTTIAFLLIGLILMAWLYMTTPTTPPHTPKKDTAAKTTTDTIKKETAPAPKAAPANVTDSAAFGTYFKKGAAAEQLVTVSTEDMLIYLTNKGGKIKKLYLKHYDNWYHATLPDNAPPEQHAIQLFNTDKGSNIDISFVSTDGKAISTADLDFTTSASGTILLKGTDSVTLTYTAPATNGGSIVKHFTFRAKGYASVFSYELNNLSQVISNSVYDVVMPGGIRFVEENSVDEANYSNASVYYGGEQVIVDATHDGHKIEQDFNGRVDWLTIRNKYFAAILAPENPGAIDGAYIKGYTNKYEHGGLREFYTGRYKMPFRGGASEKQSFFYYTGPVQYDVLKAYNNNLDKVVDFGSFLGLKAVVRPIAEYVLMPLFKFLHSFITNFGVVIIIFSLIVRLLLQPLMKTQFESMKKMQLLQPKITELKEKLKNDPQKLQSETMKLYSTYGINPAGGCLPLLLQMPIFVAMWGTFQTAIELRQQPFIFWITDLSRPDVIYHLPFTLPLFGVSQISALALLMGVTTFIQQKMSVKDPSQQALVYIMPVMLTFLFMGFPSGLNLYYFMFNLLSIGQQYYMNNFSKHVELVPVAKPKKSGFMQRLMEAAEKQQQANKKKK